MNLAEIKPLAAHFMEPLKAPLAAVSGGMAVIVGVAGGVPLSAWVIFAITVLLIVVMRTVLFFEFRVHERKEQRLYEAILATSNSFDNVTGVLSNNVKDLSRRVEDLEADDDKMAAQVDEHERRLKRIEESPLVLRMNLGLPVPPKKT